MMEDSYSRADSMPQFIGIDATSSSCILNAAGDTERNRQR